MFKSKTNTILYPSLQVERNLPENIEQKDLHLFYPVDFSVTVPEVNMITVENAIVINHYLLINKSLIQGFSNRNTAGVKKRLEIGIKKIWYGKKELESAFVSINEWGNNYFHWLTELLPGIIAARKKTEGIEIILPASYQKYLFVTQSLQLLKIKPVYIDPQCQLHIKEASMMKLPVVGQYHPFFIHAAVTEIQSKFQPVKVQPHKKIFISRATASRRKLTNEESVVHFLKQQGFESIVFESLSFAEQIQLMRETKILISTHGAGLSNMIFMPNAGSVVELKAYNNDYNCFFTLARIFNHEYRYLLCESDRADHRNADITVDLSKLAKLITEL